MPNFMCVTSNKNGMKVPFMCVLITVPFVGWRTRQRNVNTKTDMKETSGTNWANWPLQIKHLDNKLSLTKI